MKRRTSVLFAGLVAALAGASASATDNQIALNYNWNGICHSSETGQPDAPGGYRAIDDRGLYVDGFDPNALGTNPTVGTSNISYSINMIPNTLDIVHLGRSIVYTPVGGEGPPAGSPYRWWDGSGTPGLNADHGIQPTWLPALDQLSATTTLATPLALDSLSSIGVLYNVSHGGGSFDMVLGFTDSTSVTVTLSGNDWFGATNPPPAGPGVESQTRLGSTTFTGTNGNVDTATAAVWPTQSEAVTEAVVTVSSLVNAGLGNIAGKQLSSITFQNPSQPLRGYAVFAATVVTGLGPPANDNCSNPTQVFAGSNPTNNLRATGTTTSGCGNNDTSDVWYTYTATGTGLVEARTCGAQMDTTISVYTTCGGAAIACNDNACGLASRVQWSATSGANYLIRVAGNNGTTGNFDLYIDTAAVSHNDVPVTLAYNWNGMVHTGEGGMPDAPNGFRSISDRAFYASGTLGAINAGVTVDSDFFPFSVVSAAGQLDIVHLGPTGPGTPHDWDATPNTNDQGIVPNWLTSLDQSSPRRTNLAPLNKGMGPDTQIGVLFQISNGGGTFNCTLEYGDGTTTTVQLAAPDWFGDHSTDVPPPGFGVATQRQLGTYLATDHQDSGQTGAVSLNAVEAIFSTGSLLSGGLGDVNGKRLAGIRFSDPSSGSIATAIFAVTLRDAATNTGSTNPYGTGGASPSVVEQTRNVLLTVSVDPGTNPASTGLTVTGDLSSLGGAFNQQFYDDGTHGDVTAGDLVYSYSAAISATQTVGTFSLPFTVADAQSRAGSGNIPLTIETYAWDETRDGGADAGETLGTAQHTSGSGALAAISGVLTDVNDVDIYAVNVCDYTTFSASCVGGSSVDTLFTLFDSSGHGVTFDDDSQGTAQSTVTSQFLTANGLYYLAVSSYFNMAVDASGNALFTENSYPNETPPDGPGAANPLDHWDGNGGASGSYRITLTGACLGNPGPTCGSADFNCDGDVGTDADIAGFFNCLAGTCPPPPCTNSADFNGDGDVGTDADIESFFRVLAGGNC